MLAIANKHGEIQASIPGLARVAAVSVEDCERAINRFMTPDKYSRTPDDEGRRIEKIEGGWMLINHSKYRAMASKDEEKTATAIRQQRFRDQKKRNAIVTPSNAKVTPSNDAVTEDRDIADTDTDTKAKEEKNTPLTPQGGGDDLKSSEKKPRSSKNQELDLPEMLPFQSPEFALVWARWKTHRREIKHPITSECAAGQFRKFLKWGEAHSIATIEHTISQGWQGLFEPRAECGRPAPKTRGYQENLELP